MALGERFEIALGAMLASLLCVGCGGSAAHQEVRPGIDVLLADSSHLIEGRRVGLITNHTGIDQFGLGDVDRLIDAGVNLTALFAPEHGFRGNLEQAVIEHGRDSAGGLPVFSLYGEVRAPTPEMLRLVDVLLIDLQDIGGRPYTYISTALLAMEASAAQEVRVLILDRPNPIGGTQMQGPMLDTAFASFIGMLPVPLRHGMSIGECSAGPRLAPRRLVRCHRPTLGPTFSQHAGSRKCYPLPGSGAVRGDQLVGRAGNRRGVPSARRPLVGPGPSDRATRDRARSDDPRLGHHTTKPRRPQVPRRGTASPSAKSERTFELRSD